MARRDGSSTTMLIQLPPDFRMDVGASAHRAPSGAPGRKIGFRKKDAGGPAAHADLKELFQGVYDAAFIADLGGNIVDANVRATVYFGRTREDLCSMGIPGIILGTNADVLKTIRQNLQNDQFTLIYALCARSDGSHFNAEISTSLLSLSGTEYLCFFIRDITARRQAEEALQRAHDELEAKAQELTRINEELREEIGRRERVEQELGGAIDRLKQHDHAKSEFVSNVSHELKTPLTSIHYTVENMLKGILGAVPDKMRPHLQMIREDCRRLARTVEDILDLSRIEANTLALNRRRIHFPRFIAQCVESLRVQAEGEGLTLSLDSGGLVGFVDADPEKIERVVFNIVKNAVKFNVPGGYVRVNLRSDPTPPGYFVLEVADSGIGIEKKYLGRITERYFRVGEHVSGAGLGLAISKEILERHGGRIDVESPVPDTGIGTLVSIRVPVTQPPSAAIVYESPEVRLACTRDVAHYGYQVITRKTGDDAFSAAERSQLALVLLDWTQPGLEGSAVLARIKGDETLRYVPVLVLVHDGLDPVRSEIIRGMGLPTLPHPWVAEELHAKIDRLVTGRKPLWSQG